MVQVDLLVGASLGPEGGRVELHSVAALVQAGHVRLGTRPGPRTRSISWKIPRTRPVTSPGLISAMLAIVSSPAHPRGLSPAFSRCRSRAGAVGGVRRRRPPSRAGE